MRPRPRVLPPCGWLLAALAVGGWGGRSREVGWTGAGGGAAAASLSDSIVATAQEALGRPYRYGGTGARGGGFDCSGLIQYAYAEHGIPLPRRSVDQARAGEAVPREVERLEPADILTFSSRGGRKVTHVGLFLGNGRFVHSASRGVRVSRLSPDDPDGAWWWKRWVGARRVVGR